LAIEIRIFFLAVPEHDREKAAWVLSDMKRLFIIPSTSMYGLRLDLSSSGFNDQASNQPYVDLRKKLKIQRLKWEYVYQVCSLDKNAMHKKGHLC
jgi:hypothetical protein